MIYVVSNALIYLLHNVRPQSDHVENILVQESRVYTSLRTIEETSYILVRIKATQLFSVKGIYQIKKVIEEHGLKFAKDELTKLREMIQDFGITVLSDKADAEELHETMAKYKLLPGDAIIALTCKHYGINTILTFDEDFKRIPWLKVIP